MSCILNIETSTETCSVAVVQDGGIIFEKINNEPNSHTKYLAKFVEEALSFAESHAIPLDAVAVSSGPGSYTGLRIGVSTAKGICYGKNVPLIAIPTLKLLCVKPLLSDDIEDENALLCPMIDARRMEAYTAIYDRALREVREVKAEVIDATTYNEWLDKGLVRRNVKELSTTPMRDLLTMLYQRQSQCSHWQNWQLQRVNMKM